MNSPIQTCDRDRIESFLNGQLSDVDAQDLSTHLNTCTVCQQHLEEQAADPSSWNEAKSFLGHHEFDSDFAHSETSAEDGKQLPLQIQTVLDSLAPTDDPLMLGRIGGYEVSGVVGVGGMGVVLKAIDTALDRTVAIKVMAPHLATSGAAKKRFAREAKAAAAVLHLNVIAIHSVSNDASLPYLVMPYVKGHSLQKRLDIEGPLSLKETLRIGAQISAGLAAAHAQGLVHRDIKPANILLEDGVERVTITDFGLARAVDDATMTRSGVIAGTPQYMSPEQARGEVIDQRSDLFSLGSVLYAICTGRPPFRAETTFGVMRRITDQEPTPIQEINPDIPQWLCTIISKLMAKQAEDRYASASEVTELLEECLAHVQQPTVSPLPESLTPEPKWQLFSTLSRQSLGVLTMTAVFGIAIVAAVMGMLPEGPDISGQWNGPGWGDVVLTKIQNGKYEGTYTDTHEEKPGTFDVKWSAMEGQYYGTWREGAARFGKLSLRLKDNELTGGWTTNKKSEIKSDSPRLAGLSWERGKIVEPVAKVPVDKANSLIGEWRVRGFRGGFGGSNRAMEVSVVEIGQDDILMITTLEGQPFAANRYKYTLKPDGEMTLQQVQEGQTNVALGKYTFNQGVLHMAIKEKKDEGTKHPVDAMGKVPELDTTYMTFVRDDSLYVKALLAEMKSEASLSRAHGKIVGPLKEVPLDKGNSLIGEWKITSTSYNHFLPDEPSILSPRKLPTTQKDTPESQFDPRIKIDKETILFYQGKQFSYTLKENNKIVLHEKSDPLNPKTYLGVYRFNGKELFMTWNTKSGSTKYPDHSTEHIEYFILERVTPENHVANLPIANGQAAPLEEVPLDKANSLVGAWRITSMSYADVQYIQPSISPPKALDPTQKQIVELKYDPRVEIGKETILFHQGQKFSYALKADNKMVLHDTSDPVNPKTYFGLYQLNGDELRMTWNTKSGSTKYPKSVTETDTEDKDLKEHIQYFVLERVKLADQQTKAVEILPPSNLVGEWRIVDMTMANNQYLRSKQKFNASKIRATHTQVALDYDPKVVITDETLWFRMNHKDDDSGVTYRYSLKPDGNITLEEQFYNDMIGLNIPTDQIHYSKIKVQGDRLWFAWNFSGSTQYPDDVIDRSTSKEDAVKGVQFYVLERVKPADQFDPSSFFSPSFARRAFGQPVIPIQGDPPSSMIGEWEIKYISALGARVENIRPGLVAVTELNPPSKKQVEMDFPKVVIDKNTLIFKNSSAIFSNAFEEDDGKLSYTLKANGDIVFKDLSDVSNPKTIYGKYLVKGNELWIALNLYSENAKMKEHPKDATNKEAEGHVQYFYLERVASKPVLIPLTPQATPRRIGNFRPDMKVQTIAYSADGKWIAVANGSPAVVLKADGTSRVKEDWKPLAQLLHAETGRTFPLKITTAEVDAVLAETPQFSHVEVTALAFSPDGKFVALGTSIGQVKLFDTQKGKYLSLLSDEQGNQADHETPESWKSIPRAIGTVKSLAFSPDGSQLAVCGKSFEDVADVFDGFVLGRKLTGPGRLKVWDLKTGEILRDLERHSEAFEVSFSPDGKWLACVGRWATTRSKTSGAVVWDVSNNVIEHAYTLQVGGVGRRVSFSPDSKLSAIVSKYSDQESNRNVTLLTLSNGSELLYRGVIPDSSKSALFSPDGAHLVVFANGHLIQFLDTTTELDIPLGMVKQSISPTDFMQGGQWNDLAISPKVNRMVTGGVDKDGKGSIEIWEFDSADSQLPKAKEIPSGLLGEWTVRYRTYSQHSYLPPGIFKTSEDTPLPVKPTELDNTIKIVIDKDHLWFEMLPAEKNITKYPYTLKPNGELILLEVEGRPEKQGYLGKYQLEGDNLGLSFRMEAEGGHPQNANFKDADSYEGYEERNVQYFNLEREASSAEATQVEPNSILGLWRMIDIRGGNTPAPTEDIAIYIDKEHIFSPIWPRERGMSVNRYKLKSEGNYETQRVALLRPEDHSEPIHLGKYLIKGNYLWMATNSRKDATFHPNHATGEVPQPDVNYVTYERVNPLPVTAGAAPPKPKRIKQFIPEIPVNTIAYSSDAKLVAFANGSRVKGDWKPQVKVLNTETGRTISLKVSTEEEETLLASTQYVSHFEVTALAFSPDAKIIAVGTSIGQVKLFNTETGKLIRALDAKGAGRSGRTPAHWKALVRAMGSITSIAFSPDGSQLATTGRSFRDFADIFDGRSDQPIAITGQDRLKIWDMDSGKHKLDLYGHSHANSVTFSPDGKWLASAGSWSGSPSSWSSGKPDGSGGIIWALKSGSQMRVFSHNTNGGTQDITFSPDSKLSAIISRSFNKEDNTSSTTISLSRGWVMQWKKTIPNWANKARFTPDGQSIAILSGTGSIKFLDVETGTVTQEIEPPQSPAPEPVSVTGEVSSKDSQWYDFAMATASNKMVSGGVDGWGRPFIEIWEFEQEKSPSAPVGTAKPVPVESETNVSPASPNRIKQISTEMDIKTIAYSADGKLIAVANGAPNYLQGRSREALGWRPKTHILDAHTGKTLLSLNLDVDHAVEHIDTIYQFHASRGSDYFVVSALAFSPDAKILAVGNQSGRVKLFSTQTGKHLRSLIAPSTIVDYGPQFAFTGEATQTNPFKKAMDSIRSIAFSPDGSQLATAGNSLPGRGVLPGKDQNSAEPGRLNLWDVKTGKIIRNLIGHQVVYAVRFSPDGKQLVSTGSWSEKSLLKAGPITWDVETGKLQKQRYFAGGGVEMHDIALSPDGRLSAVAMSNYLANPSSPYRSISGSDADKATVVSLSKNGVMQWQKAVSNSRTPTLFTPDGKRVAVLCDKQSIRFLDAETGGITHAISPADFALGGKWNDFAISLQRNSMVTGGVDKDGKGRIEIWSFDPADALVKHSQEVVKSAAPEIIIDHNSCSSVVENFIALAFAGKYGEADKLARDRELSRWISDHVSLAKLQNFTYKINNDLNPPRGLAVAESVEIKLSSVKITPSSIEDGPLSPIDVRFVFFLTKDPADGWVITDAGSHREKTLEKKVNALFSQSTPGGASVESASSLPKTPNTKSLAESTDEYNRQTADLRRELFKSAIPDLTVEQMKLGFQQTAELYRKLGNHQIADTLQKTVDSGYLPSGSGNHLSLTGPIARDDNGQTITRQIVPCLILPDASIPSGNLLVPLRPCELIYNKNGTSSKNYGDLYDFEKEMMELDTKSKPSTKTDTGGSVEVEVVENDIIILKGKKEDVQQVQQAIEKVAAPK
ncbi:MAG: hypothetical protein COA78_18825 [Blastopirellula sp.]|nr:MAG: hypothetical protein COA78_18825 [Blastopirellula sp.]